MIALISLILGGAGGFGKGGIMVVIKWGGGNQLEKLCNLRGC